MSHSQLFPLEVTQALSKCAKARDFHFGDDTALVAVQHMLLQTVDLFKTAGEMGLGAKNIFALGKVYSNNAAVIETLRDLGVTVVESAMPAPGEFHQYFEQDTRQLWRIVAETLATRQVKRVLVLDDGGICITSIPPDFLKQYSVCGVEQTSLGMFLFEEKPPSFAVISWARAAVKLQIGGPIFSQCFINLLNRKFLGGETLQGELVGVIGMGSIGTAVAGLAVRQGNRVLYYDPLAHVQIPPTLREHVTAVGSLEELMVHCDYVVGCSGRNPFKDVWPLDHKPGIQLLSASGGDQEFGPIIDYLKEQPDFAVAPDTWHITSEFGPSGPIRIAYLGYPYNFASRAPEAVSTPIVQIESAGLLAALVQARLYLEMCETALENNHGIHRVSPKAQRFVYERWLTAMKDRNVDLIELFGYDPATLNAARSEAWLTENTEPHSSEHYLPVKVVEERMDRFICEECSVKNAIPPEG